MPGPIATAVISSLASEAVRHGTRALVTHGWNLARSVGRQVNQTSLFSSNVAAKSEFDKSLPRNALKFSPEHVERLKADLTRAQRARNTFQNTPATPGPALTSKLKM